MMGISKSEISKKIERAIKKKYPKQEIETGLANNEKVKLLNQIENKLEQGFHSSAMFLAREYISQYSPDVKATIFLGKALASLYRYDEAISTFNKLRKLLRKTRMDLIYHFLGEVYKKRGDFQPLPCRSDLSLRFFLLRSV